MTMSAPSARSSATSRSASSELAGIHLIGTLVALQKPAGADRVAERTIERARILGGVGHHLRVGVAARFQCASEWRRCARPSCRTAPECRHRPRPAPGIVRPAPRASRRSRSHRRHQAVVAVAGVGIERDVENDADIEPGVLHGAGGAADEVVGIERLARVLGAQLGSVLGNSARAGMPSAIGLPRGFNNRSTDSRSTPGMDATGYACRRLRSRTAARSDRRRQGGLGDQPPRPVRLRLRRMRTAGKPPQRSRPASARLRIGSRAEGLM